jgi:hypothetical protein
VAQTRITHKISHGARNLRLSLKFFAEAARSNSGGLNALFAPQYRVKTCCVCSCLNDQFRVYSNGCWSGWRNGCETAVPSKCPINVVSRLWIPMRGKGLPLDGSGGSGGALVARPRTSFTKTSKTTARLTPWAWKSTNVATASFWLNTDRPPNDERVLWVGAGTKDTGFSLAPLTSQVTHATDSDTNAERDYIVNELKRSRLIGDVTLHRSGERLATKHINHYITDGEIAFASLIDN